jgi:hypothetical protein
VSVSVKYAFVQLKIRFHLAPRIAPHPMFGCVLLEHSLRIAPRLVTMFGSCPARTSPPYRTVLGSIDLGGQQGITDKGDIAGDDPRVLHNPLPQSLVGLHSVPNEDRTSPPTSPWRSSTRPARAQYSDPRREHPRHVRAQDRCLMLVSIWPFDA